MKIEKHIIDAETFARSIDLPTVVKICPVLLELYEIKEYKVDRGAVLAACIKSGHWTDEAIERAIWIVEDRLERCYR